MLKKRLVGVVTVRDGWAVQSIGYRRWLPLGRPGVIVRNLDRWGVDEIVVQCIDRSVRGLGPDWEVLRGLATAGLSTPLIYAGGITGPDDAARVVNGAADRIAVDALLHANPLAVRRIAECLGAQAVVGVVPLSVEVGQVRWYDYRMRACKPLSDELLAMLADGVISEAMVVDWQGEGVRGGFSREIVNCFPPVGAAPIIAFGGLSEPRVMRMVLESPRVAAVAVGNFLNYAEHAVQEFRAGIASGMLRPASYQSSLAR